MKCRRCKKNFDEEMYSGICPHCGHFNNRQAEIDVSEYISAKFEDMENVSAGTQAAQQHAKLHEMYDGQKHITAGQQHAKLHERYDDGQKHTTAGQHAKLHETYDKYNMHGSQSSLPPLGGYQPKEKKKRDKAIGEVKEKSKATLFFKVVAVLVILITALACIMKKQSVTEIYNTLDYEQEYAEANKLFEINGRQLIVEGAEVIDTSMLPGMPIGEKLVAVTVDILPVEDWNYRTSSDTVYVKDGYSCKKPLNDNELYTMATEQQYLGSDTFYNMTSGEGVLTENNYLAYPYEEKRGTFFFFVDENADAISICFDEQEEEKGVSVLRKRVSVQLPLMEEGS